MLTTARQHGIVLTVILLVLLAVNIVGGSAFAQQVETAFTPTEQLDDANARFLSYYRDGLYDKAQVAAQQTVALARELYGSKSIEMALALGNLATTQAQTGELAAARSNYDSCIYLIEQHEGIISPRLINPLLGLAATQNALGNYDLGLKTYKRTLRVNHVELGLNNIEQMPIRDGLTESYVGLGDLSDANAQQEMQMRIIKQEFADDPEQLIAAMFKLAEWYQRSNQPEKEILHMQRSTQLIRQAAGDDSLAQIKALRGLAGAYQRLDSPDNAMRTLKKAWRINAESSNPDPLLSADILIEIGDFYNVSGNSRSARNYYSQAWEILAEANANSAVFENYFGRPVNIWQIALPKTYPANSKTQQQFLEDPDTFIQGHLTLRYDIDTNGRVSNVAVIEADPSNMLEKKVAHLFTRFFFRPQFKDGVPVLTSDLRLNHTFSYRTKDVKQDSSVKKSDSNSTGRLEYPGAAE